MVRAYISGPITGHENTARQRFEDAETFLRDAGYYVFNPERALRGTGFSYGEYMQICLEMLERCHVLVMTEGWEKSKGACIELGYALSQKNIRILELSNGELSELGF